MFRALAGAMTAAALALFAADAGARAAPAYPAKSVRIIVGFPPGQATDIVARLVADKLSSRLAQSFFVDNKPGAAGIIGTELTIKALPDVRERLLTLGTEPASNTPDEFGAYIRSEIVKWGKVIRESGAKVE